MCENYHPRHFARARPDRDDDVGSLEAFGNCGAVRCAYGKTLEIATDHMAVGIDMDFWIEI